MGYFLWQFNAELNMTDLPKTVISKDVERIFLFLQILILKII